MTSSAEIPITTVDQLEVRLSRPTPLALRAMSGWDGDLLILGAGGKMGPSLARLARRAADEAGQGGVRVIAVSRFSDPVMCEALARDGVETIRCDLLDRIAREKLPQVANVIYMVGHKFSVDDVPGAYWAMNTYLAGCLAEQFRQSRIVAFSTGNVYPFVDVNEPPPTEDSPCGPVGEYAMSCWGRERMFQFASARYGTAVSLLRLNYAVELRYGVPVDIAGQLLAGEAIDLSVPAVNLVWQGYANAVALAAFGLTTSPPDVLNLTGVETIRVRDLAEGLGRRLGIEPKFNGEEGKTALLSDASRCHGLFGPPNLGTEQLLDMIATWLRAGGATLGKPTKFQVRDGKF